MQNKIEDLIAFKEALKTYVEMCNELISKEENQAFENKSSKNQIINKTIKDINDINYLSKINKYIIKISMFDKTEMNSVIRDKKLYLALSRK